MKTSTCRNGTLKENNQTRLEWHHNTFTPSLHLVPFKLPTMHTTKVLSIAHSTVFHRSISTMFSSNKILQRNLNSNISYRPYTIHTVHTIQTQHCSWTSQFLHRGKTDHICHAQSVRLQDGVTRIGTASVAKAGWNAARITRLFLLWYSVTFFKPILYVVKGKSIIYLRPLKYSLCVISLLLICHRLVKGIWHIFDFQDSLNIKSIYM